MTETDFVVSADGHLLEPIDLFTTRLPEHLRDLAVWEEEFEIEPLRRGRRPGLPQAAHARVRGLDRLALPPDRAGARPRAIPSMILEDMDLDGVDAQVLHPNLSQFGLFTDDHELSIAHARVYNDYVIERFTPYFDRLAPTAPIPLTDIGDAVAEIERVAAGGFRAVLLPAIAADALLPTRVRPGVGRRPGQRHERVRPHPDRRHQGQRPRGAHAQGHAWRTPQQVNQPMTEKAAAKRMVTQAVMQPIVPQQLICQLIGGGVPERFPDLHFSLIEFNAYWLASLVGSMDKCWITGIGQDADWWIGVWDDDRPDDDQPGMAQLFRLNEKWPYPLMPSEYVQRQFHVSFQDDPVPSPAGTSPACPRSCGATTTRTPRARSAAARSCSPS